MKRVLLALLGLSALCAGGFLAAELLAPTGMHRAADRFLHAYSSGDPNALSEVTTGGFLTMGIGDEQSDRRRAARKHLGVFAKIEKTLVERKHKLGRAQLGEYQCLARFAKGTAIVRLRFVEMRGAWRVSLADVSIPPSLMKRTPTEYAESYALHLVKFWTNGNAAAVRRMGTGAFRDKISESVLEQVMQPLLEVRGKLSELGVVFSEPVAANERDVRALAMFEEGDSLGFDFILRWTHNRWHVEDLRVADALGETVPEAVRHSPDEFKMRMGRPKRKPLPKSD